MKYSRFPSQLCETMLSCAPVRFSYTCLGWKGSLEEPHAAVREGIDPQEIVLRGQGDIDRQVRCAWQPNHNYCFTTTA